MVGTVLFLHSLCVHASYLYLLLFSYISIPILGTMGEILAPLKSMGVISLTSMGPVCQHRDLSLPGPISLLQPSVPHLKLLTQHFQAIATPHLTAWHPFLHSPGFCYLSMMAGYTSCCAHKLVLCEPPVVLAFQHDTVRNPYYFGVATNAYWNYIHKSYYKVCSVICFHLMESEWVKKK